MSSSVSCVAVSPGAQCLCEFVQRVSATSANLQLVANYGQPDLCQEEDTVTLVRSVEFEGYHIQAHCGKGRTRDHGRQGSHVVMIMHVFMRQYLNTYTSTGSTAARQSGRV